MLSGEQLKFLRYMHGKTQQQMANWCDITRRYVIMIELNEYSPSEEVYNAWIDCCYGKGKPIKRDQPNRKKVEDDGVVQETGGQGKTTKNRRKTG